MDKRRSLMQAEARKREGRSCRAWRIVAPPKVQKFAKNNFNYNYNYKHNYNHNYYTTTTIATTTTTTTSIYELQDRAGRIMGAWRRDNCNI